MLGRGCLRDQPPIKTLAIESLTRSSGRHFTCHNPVTLSVEAKRPHRLLSVNWGTRKAIGKIQSKSKGLRTRRSEDVMPGPRAGEDLGLSPRRQAERGCILLSSSLCSVPALHGLGDAHPHQEGQCTLLSPESNAGLI